MTPARTDDVTKQKLTLRDTLLILVGCIGMYGAQIGAQWGLRSDIRDLKTSFDNYKMQQLDKDSSLQRQIDDWRGEVKLNRVKVEETKQEISELKGVMLGAGVKGVPR